MTGEDFIQFIFYHIAILYELISIQHYVIKFVCDL